MTTNTRSTQKMTSKNPTVVVDSVQKINREDNMKEVVLESLQLFAEMMFFLIKVFYYTLESLYYKIVPKEPKSVKGEIVLITGTGHGIGKELALGYAELGATVVAVDINQKNNEETVKEIAEHGHSKAFSFICDISKRENVVDLAEKVKKSVGDVTILVNNAGIMPTHPLLQHPPEEIERIMNLNVMAHFWLIQAFLPSMLHNNHGHIVSLSSVAGLFGTVNLVPYCASKFAVRGMMEALHEELRKRDRKNEIKITTICPFMVDTGLCKRPKIKYPNLMPLLSPKEVAAEIISSQRRDELELTVPRYMHSLFAHGRTLPNKASMELIDTLDTFIETDL